MTMKELKYTVVFEDEAKKLREGFVNLKDLDFTLRSIFAKEGMVPIMVNEEEQKLVYENTLDFQEWFCSKMNYEDVLFIGDSITGDIMMNKDDNIGLNDPESPYRYKPEEEWRKVATVTIEIRGPLDIEEEDNEYVE